MPYGFSFSKCKREGSVDGYDGDLSVIHNGDAK